MKRSPLILLALILPSIAIAKDAPWLEFEGTRDRPGNGKHVVLISGDEEYRSEETCPMLAKILSKHHGFKTTVLFAIHPEGGYIDSNYQKNIPGMEAIGSADLVIIGTRFRNLPDEQFQPLADHLNAGKPVVGFRTATHAFKTKQSTGGINWNRFGPEILGEGWVSHHGHHKHQGARSALGPGGGKHPVLRGVGTIFAESDVYGINAVTEKNATILLDAAVTETLHSDSAVIEKLGTQPAAWLRTYTTPQGGKGTAFATTFGASCDFDDPNLRRLLINASFFLTGLEVPEEAGVAYVDPFSPSAFNFNGKPEHYRNLNLKPADYDYGKSPQTGPPLETLIQKPQSGGAKVKPENKSKAKAKAKVKTRKSEPGSARAGPAVRSTLTSIEIQRTKKTRPSYEQPTPAEARPTPLPLNPEKSKNIVFLGNALAARMDHSMHFETLLQSEFPAAEITFRNMGQAGHTPAFRPEAGQRNPWAFPGGDSFRPEINAHDGSGHYPTPDEWLTIIGADTIVAFFGFNESFAGEEGVENFKAELSAFVDHTHSRSYNKNLKAPHLVLATPIAAEQHPAYYLPDAVERNRILSLYADAVREVATSKATGLLDLFTPTSQWFSDSEKPLTINGVHLSDDGYRRLAPILMAELFGIKKARDTRDKDLLHRAIQDKTWFWRNDYRMPNGIHAYGRRWAPYGNFNYPEEIEKTRQMTVLRDRNIWQIAQGSSDSLEVDDTNTRPLTEVSTNYKRSSVNGSSEFLAEQEALEKFILPEGYAVSVFATEKDFPNLRNPVQMRFDNHGRLWVSTAGSYPHYRPGGPRPDDKLLIYEDTDGDGRADKETVFADGLQVPGGFDFAPEGVYVAEGTCLTLHRDSDGDGRADTKEHLLDGFDPHDTHHAISAFDTDAGGGLFMCEGIYLYSQVETPWGPARGTNGGVWRFDPKSWKLERVLQRKVANPWGISHDEYGQNFLSDASPGKHHWMLGYSVKSPHAHEIDHVGKFNYEHHCRPTTGSEFLFSSHFPAEVQGDYLSANVIGFLGIKQYRVLEDGAEIKGAYRQDLIRSSDSNFRPSDLEVAPDGSLYFIDWHNPLIGHAQHSARDPLRDSQHGRIYRITCPGRSLVTAPQIADAGIAQLFQNLKLPELNARKRSHRELRGRDPHAVCAVANSFAAANAGDERLVLEALWTTWGHQRPDIRLVRRCLAAKDHRVRAAAVRVVRHCLHLLKEPEKLLLAATSDPHPRVRLEALSAGSWLGGEKGAEILLCVAAQATDMWIRNSLNSAILLLKSEAETLLANGKIDPTSITDGADKLLSSQLEGGADPLDVQTSHLSPSLKQDKTYRRAYRLGGKIFHKEGSCSTCHLENGRGLPGIYPPIANSKWVTGNKERLIKLVLHGLWGEIEVNGKTYSPDKGVPPMTAFGPMYSDAELAATLTYVRTSWGNNASIITPAEVKTIRDATGNRTQFYSPEELLKEYPF